MLKNLSIMRLNTELEGNAESIVRSFLESLGGAVYKSDMATIFELTKIQPKMRKGMPDFIYWDRKGKVWLIEVKGQTDVISTFQLSWIEQHPEIEVICVFVRNKNSPDYLDYPHGIDFFQYFISKTEEINSFHSSKA